jgi:hypothetical protein
MGARNESGSYYESGSDVTMEFAGFTLRFNADDFAQRGEDAAARLGFVERHVLDSSEIEDLVALISSGQIAHAESPLGMHVVENMDRIVGWDEDLVYWLRKLVFRGAWLDQQIIDGRLEPVFTEERGFVYRSTASEQPVVQGAPVPDWSAVAYRAGER